MRTAIFVTIFAILVALASSYPADNPEGVEKSPSEKISGGVRAVCDDAFCAKMCRLDRKRGGRCWGSVCVCDRP
ncbi:uncharacterized protein isoform X2 [Leptinotarsa decemlineata]|uniref:uncharacterized protein isoform X2 n=1 Tax=Leptinotarsa decemlineata TaxID=7539 RepID=UPI003D304794